MTALVKKFQVGFRFLGGWGYDDDDPKAQALGIIFLLLLYSSYLYFCMNHSSFYCILNPGNL